MLEMQEERERLVRTAEIMGASVGSRRVMDALGGLELLGAEGREEWRMERGGVYKTWEGVVAEREGEEEEVLWEEVRRLEEEMSVLEERWREVE